MSRSISKIESSSPHIDRWVVHSNEFNLPYHLDISVPSQPAPQTGYPIIYVLDGNAFFQTIHEQVRLQSKRSDKTGVHPSVVVSIGYPGDKDFNLPRRFYDFTVPSASEIPPKPNGEKWPESGGAHQFLHFIESELKPLILEKYQVDETRQTLLGHSLGGLFVLEVLFTKPQAFQGYIASSPSIWWNQCDVLTREADFASLISSLSSKIRLFLTVGSLELDHMVKDATALSERLQSLTNHSFQMNFHNAEFENHLSVVATTLSRALRFVGNRETS
ncbi:putative alpha/beta superfamily hydrolase [Croceifilum oryzae]|uniref:Alpha/beta superfamily hydrolase n=1 Tax=Croceifilum oryzae TaxID=1553429 RepID=A0AAJ1TLA9_9BACL|nr:alpha/beta hydrolase-fold protein [Croceifilum oryzae]MDQ0418071.1 putative alpha/beta superfamily hydrolase [Croceifilum oryzae]